MEPLRKNPNQTTIDAVKELAQYELTRYCVPEAFGGIAIGRPHALDCRALTLIRENLGWSSALLDTAFAMQGLGSYPITLAGTNEQKGHYLPGILDGSRLGAFALTEPSAGSDVASMSCIATPVDGGYCLNGEKTFISNAGVASQYIVFAQTQSGSGRAGIVAIIVDAGTAGFQIEPFDVVAPHPIGTLRFNDCFVSDTQRLGAVGDGFQIAMKTLDVFRTTVGGASLDRQFFAHFLLRTIYQPPPQCLPVARLCLYTRRLGRPTVAKRQTSFSSLQDKPRSVAAQRWVYQTGRASSHVPRIHR